MKIFTALSALALAVVGVAASPIELDKRVAPPPDFNM